jgi:hypothetical protein
MSRSIDAFENVAMTVVQNEPVLAVILLFLSVFGISGIALFTWRTSKSSARSSDNTALMTESIIELNLQIDEMQRKNMRRHSFAETEIIRLRGENRQHAEHIAENRTRITTLETDFSKIAKRTDDESKDNA